ncbi:MAG: GDYXXLXY domain-containing protein [Candidatus Omnitrophica bacterium]|nr:GDYXXLXY domain-containing protein [Candidatus Omnitrophota bacterium]
MSKKIIIGIFFGLILVQIATPLSMIMKRESILKNGMQFRFKTAPVDPYDAFRGRYVALGVDASKIAKPKEIDLRRGQKVYAGIVNDDNGFAKISQITTQRPKDPAFLTAKVSYVYKDEVFLNLPIDRYYMEEKAASRAEQVYRKQSARDKQDAYVVVRIKDGFAVIEGLYIGGKRIEEMLP